MALNAVRCHLCQVDLEESTIKRHISSFHLYYWPYACSTCEGIGDIHKTATKEAMEAHIATSHSARNARYRVRKEASKESELIAATEECLRFSTLQLSERSATGNGPASNKTEKDIINFDVQVSSNGDNMGTTNEAAQCENVSVHEPNKNVGLREKTEILRNPTTSMQAASDVRSLHFKPQTALDKKPKSAQKPIISQKMELTKISIVICIDCGSAKFETFEGKKFFGPLSEYLSMLRQSKALYGCETHIAYEPSRTKWNDDETASSTREKFEKLSQEIHSIAHLWKYGRVVAELHNYPKRAKKVLALSDVCKGLFGQDRSILKCKHLEITLADCWPFSVVTNFAPFKRLIVKEMHQDHLSEDQHLHCSFLDAIYEKKIPQNIDVQLFLYHNKSTIEFNDELKKRFRLSTGQNFEFKVLSPRRISDMQDRNGYSMRIETKSSIPQSGQAKFIARITQCSVSPVPDQQPV